MNRFGRVLGGVLIGIALLWIFQIAGALPFRNRTTNQLAASTPQDRPPVEDPNTPRTGTANFNTPPTPPTASQPLGTGSGATPSNGTSSTTGTSATGTRNTQPTNTSPALPAAW